MRVAKKEIRDPATVTDLLKQCRVGRLGTIGADGSPMIKPLNFVYLDGDIYFHSAREGEKMDDIRREERVCFEIDLPVGYARTDASPCQAGYRYRSVIAKGRALVVEDRETRLRALKALMEKYQPEGGYGPFPEDKIALTAVVRIAIDHITGKEDLR
ncbi:MAG: Pyridoxamine 5'-phosphate oxidase [Syntrophorhabdus sp. PtaB.Bin047]|nr:MAG: Pyridoxamine 5'-phosphate oxidase [Syntrophorhabdus sp. PtaB.Bin047]